MEPGTEIIYDMELPVKKYSEETLCGEIRRLRALLNQCWAAAGLLGDSWTGQPYQAWEEPSDLVFQIDDLVSRVSAKADGE